MQNPAAASLYSNSLCSGFCDWFNVRVGFYGDYVFNRHLEVKPSEGRGDIQDFSLSTNAGMLVLNFFDWIDLFGTVGVTNLHLRGDSRLFVVNNAAVDAEVNYTPSMSYSGGGRITLWHCDCFYVGVQGQYFYTRSDMNYYAQTDDGFMTYFSADDQDDYKEWEAGIGAAYTFSTNGGLSFVPYTGINFSGVNFYRSRNLNEGLSFREMQAKKLVGWNLGITALLCDLAGVTVEGRWANEKAFFVSGVLNF